LQARRYRDSSAALEAERMVQLDLRPLACRTAYKTPSLPAHLRHNRCKTPW
jgi:hypothetical protein